MYLTSCQVLVTSLQIVGRRTSSGCDNDGGAVESSKTLLEYIVWKMFLYYLITQHKRRYKWAKIYK